MGTVWHIMSPVMMSMPFKHLACSNNPQLPLAKASSLGGARCTRRFSKQVRCRAHDRALVRSVAFDRTLTRARGEVPGDPCGVGCAEGAGRLASATGPGVRAGEGLAAAESVRSPLARACHVKLSAPR